MFVAISSIVLASQFKTKVKSIQGLVTQFQVLYPHVSLNILKSELSE